MALRKVWVLEAIQYFMKQMQDLTQAVLYIVFREPCKWIKHYEEVLTLINTSSWEETAPADSEEAHRLLVQMRFTVRRAGSVSGRLGTGRAK